MLRFYCTTCEKVKRVRVFNDDVRDVGPRKEGTCRWHRVKGTGVTHSQAMDRGRIRHPNVKSHRIPAAVQKAKSKRKA